jgi:hypothetical protein
MQARRCEQCPPARRNRFDKFFPSSYSPFHSYLPIQRKNQIWKLIERIFWKLNSVEIAHKWVECDTVKGKGRQCTLPWAYAKEPGGLPYCIIYGQNSVAIKEKDNIYFQTRSSQWKVSSDWMENSCEKESMLRPFWNFLESKPKTASTISIAFVL